MKMKQKNRSLRIHSAADVSGDSGDAVAHSRRPSSDARRTSPILGRPQSMDNYLLRTLERVWHFDPHFARKAHLTD